jgi:hypothetical protein
VNFGKVGVGDWDARTVRVQNIGNGTITWTYSAYYGVTALPAGLTASMGSDCVSVPKNAHCSVTFTFKPTQYQKYLATDIAPINISTFNNKLQIMGTGVPPGAELAPPPAELASARTAISQWERTSLDFGSVARGSSKTLSVRVQNLGDASVDWRTQGLNVVPAGWSASFGPDCANVAKNGYCTVSFSFAPTVAQSYWGSGLAPKGVQSNNNTLSLQGVGL